MSGDTPAWGSEAASEEETSEEAASEEETAGGSTESRGVRRNGASTDHSGDGSFLSVRNLKKYYPVRSGLLGRHTGDVKAVDGVSFDLRRGETLAVVGESGCGKSTMAETLVGLNEPTSGEIQFRGERVTEEVDKAFRRQAQMVFQDPFAALNDRMTVGRIVAEPLVIHGEREDDREAYVRNLLETVGLDPAEYYYAFPHELSGGQRQRVGIARALALNPDLLVADEPVSALDVSIQSQILELLADLQAEFDLTYLLITHDMSVVRQIADRVAVMYLGGLVEIGDVESVFENPQHPYTEALLSSIPRVTTDPDRERRIRLDGSPPDPADPPDGCPFHPRCHLREELPAADAERCVAEDPAFETVDLAADGDHPRRLACHFRPEDD
jgi:oligopeptide/dipeptide ABC transporter ATP-binding protein